MYSLARIKGNEKREAPKKCLFSGLSGAPYWIRTSGLTLRRRALYPAELMALIYSCGAQGECTSSRLGGDSGRNTRTLSRSKEGGGCLFA